MEDFESYKNIIEEEGVGPSHDLWKKIEVQASQLIFRVADNYDPHTEHLNCLNLSESDNILDFTGLKKNPWQKVISTGIRHISSSKSFLASCPVWEWDGISDKGKLVFLAEKNWQVKDILQNKDYQLEHFFECRFAGSLMQVALKNQAFTMTTATALVLLDRITNHAYNLAWVHKDLNTIKNKYFAGATLNDKEAKQLIGYMDNMAPRFRYLVYTITCGIPLNEESMSTAVFRMLKILLDSDFCKRTTWEDTILPVQYGLFGKRVFVSWLQPESILDPNKAGDLLVKPDYNL